MLYIVAPFFPAVCLWRTLMKYLILLKYVTVFRIFTLQSEFSVCLSVKHYLGLKKAVSQAKLTLCLLFKCQMPTQTQTINHSYLLSGTCTSCVTSTKSATTILRLPTLCCYTPNCSRYTDNNTQDNTNKQLIKSLKYTHFSSNNILYCRWKNPKLLLSYFQGMASNLRH